MQVPIHSNYSTALNSTRALWPCEQKLYLCTLMCHTPWPVIIFCGVCPRPRLHKFPCAHAPLASA